jgi:GNAT superfamily N-acetyltransferase
VTKKVSLIMNTPSYTLSVEENPADADKEIIFQGLNQYNRLYAEPANHRPLAVFLRSEEGAVVGGLTADTYWGWLYVILFWLAEEVRGQGYGQAILAAAENEARQRGCHHAHLDTLSFQALPFYEKQGYTIWGVLEDMPVGHKRYYLQKAL